MPRNLPVSLSSNHLMFTISPTSLKWSRIERSIAHAKLVQKTLLTASVLPAGAR